MDYGKAFGFVFADEEWIKKILLGAVISLIPIVGQFVVLGYGITILRNVRDGNSHPLPEWGDFGDYLALGAQYWVVTLVYAIPILVIACPFMLVPLVPLLSGGNEDVMAVMGGIVGVFAVGLLCLAGAYGIFLLLLTPAIQIRFAKTGEIGASLRIGQVVDYLRDRFGEILVAQLVGTIAGGIIVSVLAGVTFGLLALPASVWITAFTSHIYGQIARAASASEPAADSLTQDAMPGD